MVRKSPGSLQFIPVKCPKRLVFTTLLTPLPPHRRWKYVITGILEVDVKPRLQMWSWQHIRRHRQMVKHYRELYKTKITTKKPSEELLRELEVRRG